MLARAVENKLQIFYSADESKLGSITVLFLSELIKLSGGFSEFDSFLAKSKASGFGTSPSGSMFLCDPLKIGLVALELP